MTSTSSGLTMLTSGASQYLHPDYLQPLPTTLDAKKSPLALLAQTCSAIGKDTSPSKPIIPPLEKSEKPTDSDSSSSSSLPKRPSSHGSNKDSHNNNKDSSKPGFRTFPPKEIPPLVPIHNQSPDKLSSSSSHSNENKSRSPVTDPVLGGTSANPASSSSMSSSSSSSSRPVSRVGSSSTNGQRSSSRGSNGGGGKAESDHHPHHPHHHHHLQQQQHHHANHHHHQQQQHNNHHRLRDSPSSSSTACTAINMTSSSSSSSSSPPSSYSKSSAPSSCHSTPVMQSMSSLSSTMKPSSLNVATNPSLLGGLTPAHLAGYPHPLSLMGHGLDPTNPAASYHSALAAHSMSSLSAAAAAAQSSALKAAAAAGSTPPAALSPYVTYARVRTPSGATTLVPVCRDPYCTNCQLTLQNCHLSATCTSPGCAQCAHEKSLTSLSALGHLGAASSLLLPPLSSASSLSSNLSALSSLHSLYHPSALAAAAHQGLPFTCNWVAGNDYCGKRFNSSEELLQHLRTHTSGMDSSSLAAASYAGLGLPSALGAYPHFAAASAPLSPNSLRRAYPTSLSPVSNLLGASRYHPYKSPLSGVPPPSPQVPQQFPPVGPFFSPYSFFGQRLGAAVP